MNRRINGFTILGMTMVFVFGTQVLTYTASAFWAEQDIYWTPAKLAEPLAETQDVFRLSIAGKGLANHLDQGTLKGIESDSDEYTVLHDDVRVRMNHYREHQVRWLKRALIVAPLFGLGLGLLAGGLVRPARKPDHA